MGIPARTVVLLLGITLLAMSATYGIASSQSGDGKYDTDGDGLIEVEFLEQLDAIRYDLDGDGKADDDSGIDAYAAAYPVSGEKEVCNDNCDSYELTRPLDFNDADSYASGTVSAAWTAGEGWLPIGDEDGYGDRFNALFDGNGHAIANLYVNRTAFQGEEPPTVGLFGYTGYSAVICNTGIVNASVAGLENVGGLAGRNMGEIGDSYATGSVSGYHHHAGGLVGENEGVISGSYATGSVSCGEYGDFIGGFTGGNWGTISSSYATGDIAGDSVVGGLTGSLGLDGIIIASYATGDVTGGRGAGGLAGGSSVVIRGSYATGRVTGSSNVGGRAGSNGGTIIASYATGAVSGEINVGGLAGESHSSRVVASYAVGSVSGDVEAGGLIGAESQTIKESVSYWDTQTTGQETSASGEGKTTAVLQSPTAYTGIYGSWNADGDDDPATGADDLWDFGTSSEYPALKFDFDGDGTASWQEFGSQNRTAPTVEPAPHTTTLVEDNCLEMVAADGVVSGAWSSACLSFNRPGSYARFYVFTLDADSAVFITLESDDTNTYLYLQKGAGRTSKSFRSQGSPDRYSRIEDGLAAGTYTIESTTYEAGLSGSFTLTISGLAPPPHTPAPIPPATPLPTPTPTLVPTSTPAPVEPTKIPGPTAIAAQEPTPAPESGGACSYPDGDTPPGAAAISMFLLIAPLAMICGLKFRARQQRGR